MNRTTFLAATLCLLLTSTDGHAQDGDAVARALAALGAEPTAAQTLEAAHRAQPMPDDGVTWQRRSRRSAWLPATLSVDALLRNDSAALNEEVVDSDLDADGAYAGGDTRALWRGDTGDRVDVRIRAEWRPRELLWQDDVLRIADLQRRWEQDARALEVEVTEWYFARRAALLALLALSPDTEDTIELVARVEEATAHLDALTGGWFSAQQAGAAR